MSTQQAALELSPSAQSAQSKPAPAATAAAVASLHARFFSQWSPRWLALPFPLFLLLLWYVAARFEWVAPQVLPSPQSVLLTFADLVASGEMFDNLKISLLRVLLGFSVGLTGGLLLGVAMGLSPVFKDYVYPLFKAFSQVPVLGWLPLLMLLVGIDEALKIILISKAALVPIALNTYKGIENVPARYVEVARVLKFSRWQLLWRVIFPAALPPIWNGVRYGFTHAWLALVVVELLASSEGLGYMIVFGRQLFQLDVVMAAVVVVGVVGYTLDQVLARIEVILLGWRRSGF
ncbi:ABC-type nitrate/sulfonate/bicarbonate transport system, permease component [Herbaspirillum sp. CF444]|uniref:ABC transporter permease n=1 Tax=Herbaspirillum sp. CF444 TaxID=1144319 RepID=UPI0002727E6D|nr:ABC transporter permease [Herbaspirillum sp. CF444]EJL90850.1 ABC-type nitrate/sulfonate/bicarbonate transport system, permease component [Herbaspirillum sp. CF444]